MNAFERFLGELESRDLKVKYLGRGRAQAQCPCHDDRTPSLSVAQADDRVLLKCFAGCANEAIADVVGFNLADLFDDNGNGHQDPEAVYRYLTADGKPAFEVVRFPGKRFFQRLPDGSWGLNGAKRVLYRLPQVTEAVEKGETVYIAEGEKDVHALERAGVTATTSPMGAGKWRSEYSDSLRGANVVVVADRDEAGYSHAREVAESLRGVAAEVKVVEPAEGKDASDHLAAGKGLGEFVGCQGVASIYDGDTATPALASQKSKLRVLDTRTLLTTVPPPLDWLVEGVFARGKLTMIGGREKRGKSLFVMGCAVRAASGGGALASIWVKPAKVLLIDAENGEREIHRRLRAFRLDEAHADSLIPVEARGFELRDDLGQVEGLIDSYRPDIVVLDSFRALWRGDERDEAEVSAVLDPLRELAHDADVALGLVHHAQKGGDEYRGSSAIGGCVEWCVMLSRSSEDSDRTRRRLSNPLARFAPEREDRWLSIQSEGDDGPISFAEVEPYQPEYEAPVRDALAPKVRAVLNGRPLGLAEIARAIGEDPKSKTLRRVMDHLLAGGEVERLTDKRYQRCQGVTPPIGDDTVTPDTGRVEQQEFGGGAV